VGWVQVLNVDGKTYVYDQKTDSTAGSTGTNGTFDTATNQWTITTSNGGKIVVDMDDASYVYTPPGNITGAKVENIGFTLTDTDGDSASANLRINVEGPTLVVGQNVDDRPGQATPHKVDPVAGNAGVIGGGGSNDVLIGDVGGGNLVGKATNVVLILDTSGSMAEAFGTNQPSRLQGLKDGVNDLIESLKSSGATDVRVHINHFATEDVRPDCQWRGANRPGFGGPQLRQQLYRKRFHQLRSRSAGSAELGERPERAYRRQCAESGDIRVGRRTQHGADRQRHDRNTGR
jgi:hypothetical protein